MSHKMNHQEFMSHKIESLDVYKSQNRITIYQNPEFEVIWHICMMQIRLQRLCEWLQNVYKSQDELQSVCEL